MIALLAGCSPDQAPPRDVVDPPAEHTATTLETGTPPTLHSAVDHTAAAPPPGLAEVLQARCGTPSPTPPRALPPNLHRALLSGSVARCNDGTAPVAYLAPATDPAHADDWVVVLEGGMHCANAEDCAVRWCGEEYYDATKMSSAWAPETFAGGGITSPSPENAFAGWNRVQLPYCSSDRWTGRVAEQVLTDGDLSYSIHFEGHSILWEVLESLRGGLTSDDGVAAMPSLVNPDELVLVGVSASGFGVLQAMDDVGAWAQARRFVGVVDAWATHPAPGVVDAATQGVVDARTQVLYETVFSPVWDMSLDSSCAAATDAWRCTDADVVHRDHVMAPRVIRSDLADPVMGPSWTLEYGIPPEDVPAIVRETLLRQAVPRTSVVGPRCETHVIATNDGFQGLAADAGDGRSFTLQDAVVARLADGDVVAVDPVERPLASCP